MSIKGTHPEEQHTKTIHQQAKDIDKPKMPTHGDDDAEMTLYSSGSRDDEEDDSPPPSPVNSNTGKSKSVAATTIDFTTTNPFASTTAGSPFVATPNPFMTGGPAPSAFVAPFATNSFGVNGPGLVTTPQVANPFLTTPAGGISQTTTTYTQVIQTGTGNPFATAGGTVTGNPFLTTPAGGANPFMTTPAGGANPFATNNANPFMTYQ